MSFAMQTEPDFLIPNPGHNNSGICLAFLNAHTLAKITTIVGALVGLAMNVAPRFVCSQHCTPEALKEQFNTRALRLTVQVGAGEFSSALLFYCLLWEKLALAKAVQVAYMFWAYHNVRIIAEAEYAEPMMHFVSVSIFASLAYAMSVLEEAAAMKVIQVSCAFWLAQGLLFVLAPDLAVKFWKADYKDPRYNVSSALSTSMARYFGYWLLSCGASEICLASGGTILHAVALWHFGCGTWMLTGFLGGEFKQAGFHTRPVCFWILYHVVFIYVLLAN